MRVGQDEVTTTTAAAEDAAAETVDVWRRQLRPTQVEATSWSSSVTIKDKYLVYLWRACADQEAEASPFEAHGSRFLSYGIASAA